MYPRFIEQQIKEALGDTRVVLLTGPRQAGKTTLVQRFAGKNMPFFTLDCVVLKKQGRLSSV